MQVFFARVPEHEMPDAGCRNTSCRVPGAGCHATTWYRIFRVTDFFNRLSRTKMPGKEITSETTETQKSLVRRRKSPLRNPNERLRKEFPRLPSQLPVRRFLSSRGAEC